MLLWRKLFESPDWLSSCTRLTVVLHKNWGAIYINSLSKMSLYQQFFFFISMLVITKGKVTCVITAIAVVLALSTPGNNSHVRPKTIHRPFQKSYNKDYEIYNFMKTVNPWYWKGARLAYHYISMQKTNFS